MFHVLVLTLENPMKPEDSSVITDMDSKKLSNDLQKRKNTSFKGDVLRLVMGTGIAQIITVIASPILTRLYGPESFGLAALFASFSGILGVMACMRYELTILLPDNERESANLLALSLTASFIFALIITLVIWFGGPQLLALARANKLVPYLWLIPVNILFGGIFTALNYWNTLTKHYLRLSIARVTSAGAATSFTLGSGFAGYASGGALIAANTGGMVVATAVLGGQILRDNGKFLIDNISWGEMLVGLKRYRKFPIVSSWSALMNTASGQMPTILLSFFFSPIIVGFYAIGYRLCALPISLLGSSIGQVFFQRAAVAKSDGSLPQVVLATIDRLLLMSSFPFLLLMVIAPELFLILFGLKWSKAGVFVQILAPWLLFNSLYSPISSLIDVLEIQEIDVIMNVALVLSRFISLVIGGVMGNVFIALIMYSISGVLIYIYFFMYVVVNKSGVNAHKLRILVTQRLLIGVVFVFPSIASKWILGANKIMIIVIAVFSALAYYAYAISRDEQWQKYYFDFTSKITAIVRGNGR